MLEQHEDQAQSVKSSSSVESRAEKKCRVEAQNAQLDVGAARRSSVECEEHFKRRIKSRKKCRVEAQNAQVQNSSIVDQVQCTRAVIDRIISLRAGTKMESSWVTSSVQTSSKISWEGNQLRSQLAQQDQVYGELNGEQTGKLDKDKPAWEQLEEQERIELAQLQTKRDADA
ncbi:hypothetical protein F511_41708 [Dorcoceras hygrometricum]|uniref:Uncharacterized protein n=1 Tax=Dorcoceras hygrometricum TaxID=472368 RepID=A0A2Z7ABX6_9LAMI|nr:hypothetical protein F511_41708 [Dorcoceras hygrometricum]